MKDDTNCSNVLNEKAAAEYIGMSRATLRRSRIEGRRENRIDPPAYLKIGRAVRYLRVDLKAWLEKHRVDLTETPTRHLDSRGGVK